MLPIIRRTKLLYALYNFFHHAQLAHNEKGFKKWGLKKKYYAPVSSKDFNGLPAYETENADPEKLRSDQLFNSLDEAAQQSLLQFANNGYAVVRGYLTEQQVDAVNAEIAKLLEQKKISFNSSHKLMFAIHVSPLLHDIGTNKQLNEMLSCLIGGPARLFSSINFLMGSEQATHSDSIHMTTYPLGGLLGVWFALEDITEENGPLHYFPQSHKLPYYLNRDYNNEGNFFFLGKKSYTDYESMIAEKIQEQKLDKIKFLAKKGDMLIWHANLFHGGDPHLNKQKTRKSMVLHYFNEEAICYHEITQRPALLRTDLG